MGCNDLDRPRSSNDSPAAVLTVRLAWKHSPDEVESSQMRHFAKAIFLGDR